MGDDYSYEPSDATKLLREDLRVALRERAEARAALARVEAERDVARAALSAVCAQVRDWICESCRTVYPGPPEQGLSCVRCPACRGTTMPLSTFEKRSVEAERDALREALEWYADEANWNLGREISADLNGEPREVEVPAAVSYQGPTVAQDALAKVGRA